jgi:hypothetical protein
MTSTTTIPVGPNGEYLGDRYDRLRSASEQLASDPNVAIRIQSSAPNGSEPSLLT